MGHGLAIAAISVLPGTGQLVPADANKGELIASQDVRDLFDEPGIDAIGAVARVRCIRERRAGTHQVIRICTTVDK